MNIIYRIAARRVDFVDRVGGAEGVGGEPVVVAGAGIGLPEAGFVGDVGACREVIDVHFLEHIELLPAVGLRQVMNEYVSHHNDILFAERNIQYA